MQDGHLESKNQKNTVFTQIFSDRGANLSFISPKSFLDASTDWHYPLNTLGWTCNGESAKGVERVRVSKVVRPKI